MFQEMMCMIGAGSKSKKERDEGERAQVFVGSKSLRVTSRYCLLYKEEDKVMMWHYDYHLYKG